MHDTVDIDKDFVCGALRCTLTQRQALWNEINIKSFVLNEVSLQKRNPTSKHLERRRNDQERSQAEWYPIGRIPPRVFLFWR
ncbi:hypothetical protein VNO77_26710 [Canavalia gladiata]|uniref:Uncharacterized protein n=1 Tax=Canavalia gladiata TaxID=3824 RepID=A0AAN9KSV4_CANGL